MTLEGYGSVFGTLDSYGDTIVKGAFAKTLAQWQAKGKNPKMLLQHGGGFFGGSAEDQIPIGQWSEMREDDHGLFMAGTIFDIDTDRAKAITAATRAKELDGLSIGFFARQATDDDKTGIRTLTEIELLEVSLVTFPASDPARVTSVRAEDALPTERELERWLRRDVGLSDTQAKTVIAKGYRQVRREVVWPDEDCGALLAALHARTAIFSGR